MSQAASDALSRAYTTLICRRPFYATILLRLKRFEDATASTMWTDGAQLGYNSTFVESLTPEELVGVLCHEVLHVAGMHPWRQAHRENRRFNVACDAVINHICEADSLQLPKGGVPAVPNTTPEALYASMPPSMEKYMEQSTNYGEVRPFPGTAAEQAAAQEQAKILVRQAVNAAKAAGQLPQGLGLFCDEALESKVPWREMLAQFVGSFAKTDYCWTRPNTRYLQTGFILPSLWNETFGEICVGADMSGSVDRQQRREIMSEILEALSCYMEQGRQPSVTVAWFDHAVYPQNVSDVDAMRDFRPKGGGGTSFRVVTDWILGQREQEFKGCIMITDGECGDFGRDPGIPVLWVLTRPNPTFTPPYGTITCTL